MQANIATSPTVLDWANSVTDSVTSKDGTTIGYYQLGHGPGVVLLHGAVESAASHKQLAEALAGTFTVYVPDRRGRGLSGPFNQDYHIQTEVEDLDALLARTGAHNVLGVSSGALILLKASLSLPVIHRAAIFEPPLLVDESVSTAWIKEYDEAMAQGKLDTALVAGMKGAQMGPPIFNSFPNWLLELLTRMMMGKDKPPVRGEEVSMRALAPTLHYDAQLVLEMKGTLEDYRTIRATPLLLGGSKSPAYLKLAVTSLEKVLLNVQRVEFPGLGHGATGNINRGGKPALVAQELHKFFR